MAQAMGEASFQFHKGPIKASSELAAANPHPCFNSIKVRLKLGLPY